MAANDSQWTVWERNFITQMQRLRETREMTQTDLARVLNKTYGLPFHQQTIQRMEAGERPVRLNEAHLIAKALDVGLDVMTESNEPSDQEMHFAVDQVRRRSDVAQQQLAELRDDWLETVIWLAGALADRLSLDRDPKDDPVASWGLEWVPAVLSAYERMTDALKILTWIAGEDVTRIDAFEPNDVIESLRIFRDQYGPGPGSLTLPIDSNGLYSAFPGEQEAQDAWELRRDKVVNTARKHEDLPELAPDADIIAGDTLIQVKQSQQYTSSPDEGRQRRPRSHSKRKGTD